MKHRVILSDEERTQLEERTRKGTIAARQLKRIRALLFLDKGYTNRETALRADLCARTVETIRRRFAEGGVAHAIQERPRRGRPVKLDGSQQAFVIATACSTPPDGRACWTMQLLADRLVERYPEATISDDTVRRLLKKAI